MKKLLLILSLLSSLCWCVGANAHMCAWVNPEVLLPNVLTEKAAQAMLSPGIHNACEHSTTCIARSKNVEVIARSMSSGSPNACQAVLYATSALAFIAAGVKSK